LAATDEAFELTNSPDYEIRIVVFKTNSITDSTKYADGRHTERLPRAYVHFGIADNPVSCYGTCGTHEIRLGLPSRRSHRICDQNVLE
jgi:hypothetical protein